MATPKRGKERGGAHGRRTNQPEPRYAYRQAVRAQEPAAAGLALALLRALPPEAERLLAAAFEGGEGRLPPGVPDAIAAAVAASLGPLAHDLIARRLRPLGGLIPEAAADEDVEAIAAALLRR